MTAFVESVAEFFIGIIGFIANILNGLLQLIRMIPEALSFIGIAFGSFPPVLATFAVAFISVSVVYLVIGR